MLKFWRYAVLPAARFERARHGSYGMNQQEIERRAEFERLGERQVYDNVKQGAIYNDEAKRQAAFRWLGDKEAERRVREQNTLWYTRWTFYAAIIGVTVGVVGVVATLFH